VVEGPPEDVAIHAGVWRRSRARPDGTAARATGVEPVLQSHTGEALEAFGLLAGDPRPSSAAAPTTTTSPRSPSSRRGPARSRSC